MKTQLTTAGFLGMAAMLVMSRGLQAEEPKDNSSKSEAAKSKANATKETDGEAYLGVALDSLSRSVTRHLPDLKGRGVEIVQVAKDSPAQHAGLKTHDILVAYDDHQVYSPEQLIKLVQHDKPGRDVMVEVFSAGKQSKLKVKLGEQPAETAAFHRLRRPVEELRQYIGRPDDADSSWETFDSMSLSRLDSNRFKAEISYRDNEGKTEHKTFEGTRQEIRAAIEKQKDLPHAERDQLLRAVTGRPLEHLLPHFSVGPGGIWWDADDSDYDYR